jgi:hypothetical protein
VIEEFVSFLHVMGFNFQEFGMMLSLLAWEREESLWVYNFLNNGGEKQVSRLVIKPTCMLSEVETREGSESQGSMTHG